jgi:superfamily II DNA or RNA helicase
MKKTKDIIQKEALEILKKNKYKGTIALDMGTGKSKLGIDSIIDGGFQKILITSPRTNLKKNWRKELIKWQFIPEVDNEISSLFKHLSSGDMYSINIVNIQTCYKWSKEEISYFDYIIFDEIHTCGPEYFNLINNAIELNIPILGLTGTLNDANTFKSNVLYDKLPILYEYYDSADDGLINKRKYLVLKYSLSDAFKVKAGTKRKSWYVGEEKQYSYLTEQIKKGQRLMAATGSDDWWNDAREWFWENKGNSEQKNAARVYLNSIKYRKEFLWNLTSTVEITKQIKDEILKKNNNKVLIFSQSINQVNKITPHVIHSKQDEEINKVNLEKFDKGFIKELGSVKSLTLGLNINGANYAIMESYTGSETDFKQKAGRTNRLKIDDIATIIWLVPINTQAEKWFDKAIKNVDNSNITYYTSINDLVKQL